MFRGGLPGPGVEGPAQGRGAFSRGLRMDRQREETRFPLTVGHDTWDWDIVPRKPQGREGLEWAWEAGSRKGSSGKLWWVGIGWGGRPGLLEGEYLKKN